MKLYKLTDRQGLTHGETQWGEGIRHEATGIITALCSDGLIHAYEDKYLAALLNPIHAGFTNPQLWEAEGEGELVRDGWLKCGVKALTTLQRIELPEFTTNQRVAFAIYCAQPTCNNPAWNRWANDWLAGTNRTKGPDAEAVWIRPTAAAWAVKAVEAFTKPEVTAAYAAWESAIAIADIDLPAIALRAYEFERE